MGTTMTPFLLLVMMVWACPSFSAQPPKVVSVEARPVKLDTVTDEVTSIGSLLPKEEVIIRSEIAGRILAIHSSEGETVEENELLVTLDPSEYEARLAESEATVQLNQLNFERTKDILKKNLTSRQTYDEILAKLEESLARRKLDQIHLEKTKIFAPFQGVLGLRHFSQGAYIQAGQDLISLVDKSSVKLDFRIAEKFLSKIHAGQLVNVRVDSYPQEDFRGKVYAIDPSVDLDTRTVLLRAEIPNPKGLLSPGMFARVRLVLEERQRAMLIPEQAIVAMGEESFVFKIVNGKASLTKVILGQRCTGDVEVQTGLKPSDTIVVSGQLKLREGTEVSIIKENLSTNSQSSFNSVLIDKK